MRFHIYEDVTDFLNRVEAFYLKEEVTHNLPLGILYRLKKENKGETNPFMACVTDESERLNLVLVMTPPHHLIVAGLIEAIPFAVDVLVQEDVQIPSVIGVTPLVEAFAVTYSQKTDQSYYVEMSQRIYRLDRVILPKQQDGHFRVGEEKDINQLALWLQAFDLEATGGTQPKEWAMERAVRGVAEKTLYVWEHDSVPVSMAGVSRPTLHGITVSLVYTPPKKRGKGYASNCVAALSQTLLDKGYEYCSLYTDLLNPTSNKIYQAIGYEPVADSTVLKFTRNRSTLS